MKNILFMLLLTAILSGCATMPTQQEIANLDYGAPLLTIDYQQTIKQYFENSLFDPYSAVYEFNAPKIYWYKETPFLGGRLYAGYMVFITLNAKNRMGGYVGKETYGFLFKNNTIINVLSPEQLSYMKDVSSNYNYQKTETPEEYLKRKEIYLI